MKLLYVAAQYSGISDDKCVYDYSSLKTSDHEQESAEMSLEGQPLVTIRSATVEDGPACGQNLLRRFRGYQLSSWVSV